MGGVCFPTEEGARTVTDWTSTRFAPLTCSVPERDGTSGFPGPARGGVWSPGVKGLKGCGVRRVVFEAQRVPSSFPPRLATPEKPVESRGMASGRRVERRKVAGKSGGRGLHGRPFPGPTSPSPTL